MNWCQNMTHPVPSFLSRCSSLSTLEYARNLGRTQRQRHRPSCKSFACWRASSGRKHRRTQPQSRCLGCHWRFWWKKHHRYDGQSEMKRAHIWADWPTPIWNFLVRPLGILSAWGTQIWCQEWFQKSSPTSCTGITCVTHIGQNWYHSLFSTFLHPVTMITIDNNFLTRISGSGGSSHLVLVSAHG